MAQKDYVSRGRAPQNKKNTKQNSRKAKPAGRQQASRQQQTPPTGVIPWIRVVGVLVLLIGFASFLWSIKDSAPADNAQTVSAPPPKAEDELPELPKEEWEYIKTLPGYEVEVDVEEREESDKRYLMQCASFRTRPQAEEMKAKIAFQGFEAQIRRSSGDNGDWFRVILGPFDSKRDAERTKHSLRKINIATCQIWYWSL